MGSELSAVEKEKVRLLKLLGCLEEVGPALWTHTVRWQRDHGYECLIQL